MVVNSFNIPVLLAVCGTIDMHASQFWWSSWFLSCLIIVGLQIELDSTHFYYHYICQVQFDLEEVVNLFATKHPWRLELRTIHADRLVHLLTQRTVKVIVNAALWYSTNVTFSAVYFSITIALFTDNILHCITMKLNTNARQFRAKMTK